MACTQLLALALSLVVLPLTQCQQPGVVSFLAPADRVSALETLGPNSQAARPVGKTPLERGTPSWGAYLTAPDAENAVVPGPTTGTALLYLNGPDTLAYNITLNMPFGQTDQLQSILLSVPQFIDSSAVTLGYFYGGNATGKPQVIQQPGTNGSVTILGTSTTAPGIDFRTLIWNLSSGHTILNMYTAQYPQPDDPMGCCNNAEVRSSGFLEPLDASALPLGGLRQDHHGYESMPVSPGGAIPFHAALQPLVNVTSGGVITMLVAPDNSSITYNVTLGGLAPGNEIYNVSVWFGTGATRQLGWYPYSLYSFAQNRLPTPRGGLLAPVNGANFTLATGWVGKFVDGSTGAVNSSDSGFFADPSFSFGLQELAIGNVYIVIGTADHPTGELQGHAVEGWASA